MDEQFSDMLDNLTLIGELNNEQDWDNLTLEEQGEIQAEIDYMLGVDEGVGESTEDEFPTYPSATQIAAVYERKAELLVRSNELSLRLADMEDAAGQVASYNDENVKAQQDKITLACQMAILNKDGALDGPSNPGKNDKERDAINHELFASDYEVLRSLQRIAQDDRKVYAEKLFKLKGEHARVQTDLRVIDVRIASLEMLVKWGYAG